MMKAAGASLPPSKPPSARHRPGARSARRDHCPRMIRIPHLPCEEFCVMKTRTKRWRPYLEIVEDRCVPSTFAAFGLDAPGAGPFPSDRFTVADANQLTNRRVNLPLPDAATRPSDYADVSVINTLDGFNLQPRLSIPFSGPIDVTTVNSSTIFLIRLGDTISPEDTGGEIVGINQIVWDVATNTLHVESDDLLDQHTRYALIVTRGLRDGDGL